MMGGGVRNERKKGSVPLSIVHWEKMEKIFLASQILTIEQLMYSCTENSFLQQPPGLEFN